MDDDGRPWDPLFAKPSRRRVEAPVYEVVLDGTRALREKVDSLQSPHQPAGSHPRRAKVGRRATKAASSSKHIPKLPLRAVEEYSNTALVDGYVQALTARNARSRRAVPLGGAQTERRPRPHPLMAQSPPGPCTRPGLAGVPIEELFKAKHRELQASEAQLRHNDEMLIAKHQELQALTAANARPGRHTTRDGGIPVGPPPQASPMAQQLDIPGNEFTMQYKHPRPKDFHPDSAMQVYEGARAGRRSNIKQQRVSKVVFEYAPQAIHGMPKDLDQRWHQFQANRHIKPWELASDPLQLVKETGRGQPHLVEEHKKRGTQRHSTKLTSERGFGIMDLPGFRGKMDVPDEHSIMEILKVKLRGRWTRAKDAFLAADMDSNGALTKPELQQLLARFNFTTEEVDTMWMQLRKGPREGMTYSEFVAVFT